MSYQPSYNTSNPVYTYSADPQPVPIQTNYGQTYSVEPNLYATSPAVGGGDFQQPPPTDYKPHIEGKFERADNYYRDPLWAVLFIINLLCTVIVFAVAAGRTDYEEYQGWVPDLKAGDVVVVLQNYGILTALSIVVALSLLQLMKSAPVTFIWAAIIFNFCAFLAIMIWGIVSQLYIYTIFFALGLLIWVFFFFSIRPFISFTAELLRTAATIAGQYPTTQLTAFGFLALKVGWMFFWAYTVLLVQRRFSDSAIKFLSVWLIFSFYWTFQVLLNIVHTTVSGFYATWYFMSGTWGMPEKPVAASLKRAVTTSFGSICLGSLIVALIQTVRTLLRNSRGQRDNILAAIADCLLSWIEAIARYFNEYAFVYVATYGKPFCESARAVWELFEGNGLSAIINDSIVSKVMFMGTVSGGIFVGIAGMILPAAFGVTGGLRLFISGGAFLLGFVLVGIMLQVVSSGITTIFVCYAEDSEALRRNQPALYEAIRETFGGAVVHSDIVV